MCLLAVSLEAAPAKPTLVFSDCDSAAEWTGGTVDRELKREGEGSVRWAHAESAGLQLRGVPGDWSEYNQLSLWIHSAKATGSRFLLYLGSENHATEGSDYYSRMFTLDFVGWRRFQIPFATMGASRSPRGWDQLDVFRFTASGWGNEPHPEAIVHIDEIILTKEPPVTGPRLTDERFFAALNLELPELAPVAAAVAQGDYGAARRAFVAHLKTRQRPLWHFDWRGRPTGDKLPATYDTGEADRIAANDLVSCGIRHQFGDTIDWSINPTELKYSEWTWQLSRHPFWVTLGRAYWGTGEEKYAEAFVRQMTGWVRDNPVPVDSSGNSTGSRWRTIETGIRTFSSWPNSFFHFLSSPSFTDDAVVTMVMSFVEHAHHLAAHPTSGNWVCMEMNGLFHIGTLFPEFRDAASWRQMAVDRLHEELTAQVYPDGAQIELAPGYHGVSLHNFVGTLELAKLNGIALPEDYTGSLERMYEFYLKIAMPDRCTPALNDSGWGNVEGSLRKGFSYFPERTDFQWLGSGGREGVEPSFTSCAMPWSGWYMMRSGWERDALYLHLDAGPFGYGHQHEDKLSILLHAHGKRLLTEGGVYAYDSSPSRRYVLSTRAHNTTMIDGFEQSRRGASRDTYVSKAPLDNRWITTPVYDYAEGRYDEGYGKDKAKIATHYRRVVFLKPKFWLVIDRLLPNDAESHRYDAIFHVLADEYAVDERTGAFVGTSPGQAGLAIHPLSQGNMAVEVVRGQKEPVFQGWVPGGGQYNVVPVPTPVYTATGAGPLTMAWILQPLRPGEASPIRSCVTTTSENGEIADIGFVDGTGYRLLLRHEGDAPLRADGTVSTAELTLVERGVDGTPQRLVLIE